MCTAMLSTAVLPSFCHSNSCYDNVVVLKINACNKARLFNPTIPKMAELDIENSDEIVRKVKKFMRETCGCALGLKGRPCSDQFKEETVLHNLNNCLELLSGELDLVILANIQVFTKREKVGEKRSRSPRCSFIYQTSSICKEMFLHLYGIGYSRFRRLSVCP